MHGRFYEKIGQLKRKADALVDIRHVNDSPLVDQMQSLMMLSITSWRPLATMGS